MNGGVYQDFYPSLLVSGSRGPNSASELGKLAPPAGFEPAWYGLEVRCLSPLGHGGSPLVADCTSSKVLVPCWDDLSLHAPTPKRSVLDIRRAEGGSRLRVFVAPRRVSCPHAVAVARYSERFDAMPDTLTPHTVTPGASTTVAPVRPDVALDEGDHERMTHIVLEGFRGRRGKFLPAGTNIVESMVTGTPVRALCGKVWVPNRDPNRYPLCPT